MVVKLWRENLASNVQQMNEGSNIQSFFQALLYSVYMYIYMNIIIVIIVDYS